MTNPIDRRVKTLATSYTVLVVVAAVAGGVAVPALQTTLAETEQPDRVAVVTLDSLSITGQSAAETARTLRELRENDTVEAVVLRVASPGGSIAGSEAQYRAVRQLAETKPVVASVRGYAASGGYYTILPADRIFAQPGSIVGSVGVLSTVPENKRLPAQWQSAPDKGTLGPADAARARAQTWKRSFVGTVMDERGEALELSRTEVARAKVYAGNRAVELGVADEIGGLESAIADAAERAGTEEYRVTRHNPSGGTVLTLLANADRDIEDPVAVDCVLGPQAAALEPSLVPQLEVTPNATC